MNKKLIAIVLGVALLVLFCIIGIRSLILKGSMRKLEMTVERIDAIYEYGNIQYSQKDYDKAIRAFEIIVAEETAGEKKEEVLLKLAEMYEKKNNSIKAKEFYQKFIKDFPASEEISQIQSNLEEMNINLLFSSVITENSFNYKIKPNDTLSAIAARYNTTVELLKISNNLKSDVIIPGKFLKVQKAKFGIFVDKSQNMLFLKKDEDVIKTYRVSTGADNSTPVGTFKIEEKLLSPVWYKIGAVVSPDSPEYELGTRWMGLSIDGYGIHGTKDPKTIGSQITKGCVRMLNKDVEELYTIVPSGTMVIVVD